MRLKKKLERDDPRVKPSDLRAERHNIFVNKLSISTVYTSFPAGPEEEQLKKDVGHSRCYSGWLRGLRVMSIFCFFLNIPSIRNNNM